MKKSIIILILSAMLIMTSCTKQSSESKSSIDMAVTGVTHSTEKIQKTVEICGKIYDTDITEWTNNYPSVTLADLQNLKCLTKLKKLTLLST